MCGCQMTGFVGADFQQQVPEDCEHQDSYRRRSLLWQPIAYRWARRLRSSSFLPTVQTASYELSVHFYLLVIVFLSACQVVSGTFPSKYTAPPVQILPHLYQSDRHSSFSKDARILKVFSINMWGLRWPLGEDDTERFKTLRDILRTSDYDFVLLQEVWYKSQYNWLKGAMPYITNFEAINPSCSGKFLLPIGCSGLVILSKHPIEFADIRPFSVGGSFWDFDGEVFVRKGIARARSRWNGFSVDIFTTHLVSYTNNPNYDNTMYRYQQAEETARAIRDSDADIKLFGGDLNALPYLSERQPYRTLRTVVADSLTDMFHEDASFHPFFATFGNPKNSYKGSAIPERIDYLMFASSPGLKMRTFNFMMPFHMGKDRDGTAMSVSDHEGIYSEFLVEKRHDSFSNKKPYKSYKKYKHHKTAKRSTASPVSSVSEPTTSKEKQVEIVYQKSVVQYSHSTPGLRLSTELTSTAFPQVSTKSVSDLSEVNNDLVTPNLSAINYYSEETK